MSTHICLLEALPFDPPQLFAEISQLKCLRMRVERQGTMIKDIVLALEVGASRDAARDYAISVSAAFNAHLAAIGFAYEPMLPPMDTGSAVPFDILDAEREAEQKGRNRCHRPVRRGGAACRRLGRVAPSRGLARPAPPMFSDRSRAHLTCPLSARPIPTHIATA